jgi:VWFA-related protein
LVQTVGDKNRIALYALGKDLHILQDFTDDPQKLIQAVAKLDSGDQFNLGGIDPVDPQVDPLEKLVADDMKRDAAVEAIKKIIRHMEGVPGRKNLIWMAGGFDSLFNPQFERPQARILLGQANIAVYPVMVRSLQDAGIPVNAVYSRRRPAAPVHINDFNTQIRNRELGESLGGFGFDDAADALKAVRTAEEDANNYYVLGFYPSDEDLDGGTHQLVLNVSKKVASRPDLALQYRQVYLASKPSSAITEDTPSVEDLFGSPLNATAIGLAANIVADPAKPGGRQIQVTVKLADIQLRHEKGRSIGSFNMVVRFEEAGVPAAGPPSVQTVPINLTDAQMQEYGMLTQPIPQSQKLSTAHIVVQDGSNGAAGSLRVPIPEK